MPKALRSSWYQNGEDVIFDDPEFHELAYRITSTYQRHLAELEHEHGERKARIEAWIKGWRHEHTTSIGEQGQVFQLPGYELRIVTRFDADGLRRLASIQFCLSSEPRGIQTWS